MASIHSTYISAVYGNLRYRPTWLPGTPTRLGDVGTLDDGIFRPVTSLANLGIAFSVTTDEVPDKSLDLTSATGSSVDFKLKGTTSERFKALSFRTRVRFPPPPTLLQRVEAAAPRAAGSSHEPARVSHRKLPVTDLSSMLDDSVYTALKATRIGVLTTGPMSRLNVESGR